MEITMSPLSTGRLAKALFGAIVTIMIAAGAVSCGDGGTGQLPDDDNRGMADAGDGGTMPPNQVFDGGGRYGTATTGEACRSNATCESGNCVQTSDFPGGYCTTSNCSQDDKSCTGEDAVCVANGQEPSICLDSCTSEEDCRDGYECAAHPDASTDVCIKSGSSPGDGYVVGGDDGSPTGAGCDGNGQCEGGTCVESGDFNDGYCTSVGCQSGDCAGNATCVDNSSGPNLCMKLCSDESDCRPGYACEPSESAGSSICVPDGTNPDDGYRVDQPGGGGTGSSCLVDSACRGETCLRTSEFSEGYCTSEGCGPPGTSGSCDGEGGVCLGNSKGPNICLSECSGDGDCRSGYTCQTASSASGKQVCAPAGTDPDDGYEVGGGPNTGQPCQQNSDCGSGVCMQSDGFEGGYCTEPDCGSGGSGSCEGDATCLENDRGPNVCLVNCSEDSDCRGDYECISDGDGNDVCVPEGSDPESGYDVGDGWHGYTGDDCDADSDCVEGTCVQTKQFPDGYCSTLHCHGDYQCSSEDAECKQNRHGTDMCMRDCSNGCRDGYECEDSVCVPDGSTLNSGFEPTRYDMGFLCLPEPTGWRIWGQEWTFKFGIDSSTESYVVVPVTDFGTVRPMTLDTPSRSVDLVNSYRHHNYSWGLEGDQGALYGGTYGAIPFTWPIQVPYAPQYSHYVRSGTHHLEVLTSGERPCLYVVEDEGNSSGTIDINVYPVSNTLSSSTLPNNSAWNEVLSDAESLFQTADISFGDVDYRSVSTSTVQNYHELESREEVNRAMGLGERTGPDRDDYLEVDIILVDDIILEEDGRESHPDGFYGNVPGAPGLHGNPRNGLLLNTRDLGGSSGQLLGYRLAHYMGHFLGLRHTTESVHNTSDGNDMENNYGTTDPIADTPVCQNIEDKLENDITECPDFQNLMFPVAPPANPNFTPSLTAGQKAALMANPLVK